MRLPLILATALLFACPAPPPADPGAWNAGGKVLVNVDGEEVTDAMLRAALARFRPEDIDQIVKGGQGADILNKMARAQALYHRALAQKLQDDPEIKARLIMAQRDVLMQAMIDRVSKEATTDAAIQKAYDDHKVQYAAQGAKVRVIFLKDLATAETVKAQLAAGADFGKVAADVSLDKNTGAKGGEVGWVTKGQLQPFIDTALFASDVTGLIGPLTAENGSVLIDVEARRDSTPLDEVRDQLKEQVKNEAVEAYITALDTDVKLDWKDGNAPTLEDLLKPADAAAATPAEGEPAAPAAPTAPAEPAAPAAPEAPAVPPAAPPQ